MANDHERIDELLAGYALRSLSGTDAAEADRLLGEHVPDCPRCRDTLAGFQALSGDLALGTPPAKPPEILLPRTRQALNEKPARSRRTLAFGVAAGIAALLVLGAWSLFLGRRASVADQRAALMREAIGAATASDATMVTLDGGLTEISAPSIRRMYLVGHPVAPPAPGHVYAVWLGARGQFGKVGEFLPEGNLVVLELEVDTTHFDSLLITEELPGASTPTGPPRWIAGI